MTKFLRSSYFPIFLIALLFIPVSFFGLRHFKPGYVVLNNSDTLYGSIMDRKPHPFGRLFKKIKFKGSKRKAKYGPKQLKGYKKGNSLYERIWVRESGPFFNQNYTSVPGTGEPVFLRVIDRGVVSHYHWEFEDPDSGYIDHTAYFKKQDNPTLARVNQGILGLKRKNLARFFSDCPILAEKIKNKELNSPSEIVKFYNEYKENPASVQD